MPARVAIGASDIIGIAGVVVALIGILVGVLYARRRPNLVFHQEGRVVVRGQPDDDLEVYWRGKPVPAFSRTRLWVWNAGSATLDRSAAVPGYPLRLSFGDENTEVLDVEELLVSKEENGFLVERDPDQLNSVPWISSTWIPAMEQFSRFCIPLRSGPQAGRACCKA
jgi:hypothetical protein